MPKFVPTRLPALLPPGDREGGFLNAFPYAITKARSIADGYYVDRDDYNFYFREGFRRGYEDGFNSRYQYGSYSNGKYAILGAILGSILDFQSLR